MSTQQGLLVALAVAGAWSVAFAGSVRNGSFGAAVTSEAELAQHQQKIETLRHQGWTCPDANQWPWSWDGQIASNPVLGGRSPRRTRCTAPGPARSAV